jgi:hypothetical protein
MNRRAAIIMALQVAEQAMAINRSKKSQNQRQSDCS